MVKQAIFTVTPRFSARRMVKDYVGSSAVRRRRSTAGRGETQVAPLDIIDVDGPQEPPNPCAALCAAAKDVTEPRGDERYCRDCWDKKIAVEDIVAREFTLKRYIRAHSAEKYLVYHSTQKRPVGQLLVARRRVRSVPDAAALPVVRVGRRGVPSRKGSRAPDVRRDPGRRRRRRRDRAVGRRQVAPRGVPIDGPEPRTGTANCRL